MDKIELIAKKLQSIVLAGLILAISGVGIYAQPAEGGAEAPPSTENQGDAEQGSDENRLTERLLNNFEDAEDWRAFSTSPLGDTKIKKTVQVGPIEDKYNPGSLTPEEAEEFVEGENHVLGVKTYFVDRGFDRVEVKPPHEYAIKGIGTQVSIWVLGRQYRHTLYVKLRDYRGNVHKIRMGRLDFFGWRKLSQPIPGWLPQSQRYAMFDKNLHFVSIFVVSDEKEVPGEFYFYVDNLKVLVDKSEMDYPGSKIKDTW